MKKFKLDSGKIFLLILSVFTVAYIALTPLPQPKNHNIKLLTVQIP